MDKCLDELKSIGDFKELRGDVQATVNSVVAEINKKIQALRAFEAAKHAELQTSKARGETLEVQLKVCMTAVPNMGNGRSGQVSATPKGNVLRPLAYNWATNVREIDNFFWGHEAYF